MTKQEKVRGELIKYFTPPNTTFKGNPILEENITQVVDGLLELEDKLGVVIKVEDPNMTPVAFRVAVEPLIKE